MAVREITIKERIIKRLETLDQAELEALETQLDEITKPTPEEIERRLEAWRGIFGLLSDPEEYAEFEKHARRRPLFGERTLDLGPDEEV